MKKAQDDKNYIKEISEILKKLEILLSDSSDLPKAEQLNQAYALCHNIDEVSVIFGLNSISGIFSPIEQGLSNIVAKDKNLSDSLIGIIISTISLTYTLLKDPSLKTPGVKTNYDNLKKEIKKAFLPDVGDDDERQQCSQGSRGALWG